MVKRHLPLALCVYVTAISAAFGQNSYIFQLPGQTGLTTQIVGLGDNDFHRVVSSPNGPSAASRVLATPNGSKFYVLAPGGIFSAGAALTALTPVSAIATAATDADVTPDGKYLWVIADHLYFLDVATDGLAAGADVGVPTGATPIGVAVSHDAKTAWVLSNTTAGSTVTAVDLATFQPAATPLNLPATANSIVLSSRAHLYVATADNLYDIDPVTLSVTPSGKIPLPGHPGALHFTPDGNSAYFLNGSPCSTCSPVYKLNVQSHSISQWLPDNNGTPPVVDQILVAGNDRVFAYSSATTKLWDVTPTPLALTPSVLGNIPTSSVLAAAVSNERPSSRYLYLLIADHSFYRVSLANNGIDGASSLDPANGTTLSFVPIPSQSGASSLFQINPIQTVAPGAQTILIGEVLDPAGRPVFGVHASFSANSATGINIQTPSLVTTAEGWAQTVVTAPSAPGTYTVTLAAGSLSADFQLVVGTSHTGGDARISIYSGDGQLLRQNESTIETQQPLTVRVTDAQGNPLQNIAVGFSVTEGLGTVPPGEVTTDINGLATTNFTSGTLFSNTSYLLSKVTASSALGSVEFYETTQDATVSDPHPPNSEILTPVNQRLTISQGGFLPGAITARTLSGHTAQPIPNVGLRLADPNDLTKMSSVVSCQGLSRGDNNGISSCDVQAACPPSVFAGETATAFIAVGEYKYYGLTVTITAGVPSQLSLVSGNNQTGSPGDSFTLVAQVTDGCGQPAGGFSGLDWAVIQGSADLSQAQTSSDSAGSVSARVTLGSVAGGVRVQLTGPGLTPAIFNLTTQILATSMSLVSGSGQSAITGQAFANPVVFLIRDASNNPLPGLTVSFSASNGASVNPASATTDAQGHVQTAVTAGATPGSIIVTAKYNTLSATATLSSHLQGPQVTNTSFRNAASFAVGLTPCGLATVTGDGLASTIQGVVSGVNPFGPLPYGLAGVSITVSGFLAPIQAVANQNNVQQVNFQAPCNLAPGTATIVVTVNGASTTVTGVPVFNVQPGIFTYTMPGSNKLYGAVIHASDGTYVTPTNPAQQGERYYVVVTGLGQVAPAASTGSTGTGSQNVNLPIIIGVADRGVPVLSARYLIGSVGAYIVEFQLPLDSPVGTDQSLAIAALDGDQYKFGNPVFLPKVIAAP